MIKPKNPQKIILNRKSIDPTNFVYTGDTNDFEETKFDYYTYSKNQFITNRKKEEKANITGSGITTWISVTGLKDVNRIANFCQENGMHRLSIQDILDINQRPKFQKFNDYLFLTLKRPKFINDKLKQEQISFVIKENCLISFQDGNSEIFDHIIQRLSQGIGVIREKMSFTFSIRLSNLFWMTI